jgi:DNA-binding beta-propeller fold protein YncE
VQPDSLGIAGRRLYVTNRGDATAAGPNNVPPANPGTVAPTLTGFTINAGGSLSPLPDSTVTFPVGTVPSQSLISRDGRFVFEDVFGVNTAAESNTLAPFQIRGNGALRLAPGGGVPGQDPGATDPAPALLGADVNPRHNIIYAGLTGLNEVAVFTYDATGRVSFVGASAPSADGRAPCWVAVSPDGRFLYTGDTGSDSVGVYSLADPLHPVQLQELFLGGPLTPPGSPPGTPRETAVFQVTVDPSGRFVYAVNQNTDRHGLFQEGNQLHVLSVARDGTLREATRPTVFAPADAPGTAHPQGIAVVPREGGGRDGDGEPAETGRGGAAASSHGGVDLSEVGNLLLRERR